MRDDWIEAPLAARIDWDAGLATFVLDGEVPDFVPGQFVRAGLERDGEILSRPYSLASAPGAPLELFVVRVEGGALTPALFEAPLGTSLWVHRRAAGLFSAANLPDAPTLWLVATGAGLAPYVSMLREGSLFSRFGRVIVVQAARRAAQLAYGPELDALERAGRLRRVTLLSREERPGVLPGRITTALADGRLEGAAGEALDPERSRVMLCGNPEMIAESVELLEGRGFLRHRPRRPGHFLVEKFW